MCFCVRKIFVRVLYGCARRRGPAFPNSASRIIVQYARRVFVRCLTNRKSSSPERHAKRLVDSPRRARRKFKLTGAVDLTGTTACLHRDYQRPRKWGQVQRGVPSNSIPFSVAVVILPDCSKSAGSLSERTVFNSSQFPPVPRSFLSSTALSLFDPRGIVAQ